MLFNCGVGEDSWESLGLQGDPTSSKGDQSWVFIRRTDVEAKTPILWRRADSFGRSWCWERLKAGGEGDDIGWDGWMASPTWSTWLWVNSGSWWWTGRPGVLRFMGSQRVGHNWATELNWVYSSGHFEQINEAFLVASFIRKNHLLTWYIISSAVGNVFSKCWRKSSQSLLNLILFLTHICLQTILGFLFIWCFFVYIHKTHVNDFHLLVFIF